MRIITEAKLREFCEEHPEATASMKEWKRIVRGAKWRNFVDLRATFNHADVYSKCVVFDVGGNNFRIIGKVAYGIQAIFIREVLTHAEYSARHGKLWKPDCE